MASKTDILNKALTMVGATAVTSITDSSTNALHCRHVYEVSRRSILAECKWNFATRRVNLSVSADTVAWNYSGEGVIYVRPADVITIHETNVIGAKWRVEGDYILSDTTGLGILYTFDHDTPSSYPPLFVDAFTDLLAANIAYIIVNSGTLGERYLKKYQKISLPKAMAVNSQQGEQVTILDDAWENAKYFDGQIDA